MKRSLLVFLFILGGIFILLSLMDRGEYGVEKKFWRIEKGFVQIAQDPKVVPAKQFEAVAAKYQALIRRYPKSRLAPLMQIQTAKVYMLKKDFSGARKAFEEVVKRYPNDPKASAAAILGIGSAFEQEKDEAQAVKTYQRLVKEYPFTDIGMSMPLYIANYYLRLNKNVEADTALKDAQKFYQKVIVEKKASPEEFDALRFLGATQMAQQQWDEALKTLAAAFLAYARSPYLNAQRAQGIIQSINVISLEKLKDIQKPILIYQAFIEKNPGHPLNKSLMEMIGALQKIKIEASVPTEKGS